MKLENIEHARFRALAQITLDKEKGVDAFEEYMRVAFPYLESTKQKQRQEHIEMLKKEVTRGVISVKPVIEKKLRSRLKTQMVKRKSPQTKEQADHLYRKLGNMLQI